MSMNPSDGQFRPDLFTPPTQPGAIEQPRKATSWPTVIGVIAIVYGVIGLLGGACGLVSQEVVTDQATSAPAGMAMTEEMQSPAMKAWSSVGTVIGLGLSVLLIGGGIQLTRRRRNGGACVKVWAVANILMVLVGMGITMTAMTSSMEQMPGTQFPGSPGFFEGMIIFSLLVGVLIGCAVPVFMLIWFSRKTIKDEVAGWL